MTYTIRPAKPEDAVHLAELVNLAGEGMPLYLWEQAVGLGQDPWAHGRKRAVTQGVGFNYRNTDVAVIDEKVVGSVAHYPLPDKVEPIDPDTSPIFMPLLELEAQAPGTHYVNVVAVYPEYQGQGIGRGLLTHVATTVQDRKLSLIVEEANVPAIGLYQSAGFEFKASRPIVDGGWGASGDAYCLMVRD